jgi:hypothetical protein
MECFNLAPCNTTPWNMYFTSSSMSLARKRALSPKPSTWPQWQTQLYNISAIATHVGKWIDRESSKTQAMKLLVFVSSPVTLVFNLTGTTIGKEQVHISLLWLPWFSFMYHQHTSWHHNRLYLHVYQATHTKCASTKQIFFFCLCITQVVTNDWISSLWGNTQIGSKLIEFMQLQNNPATLLNGIWQ